MHVFIVDDSELICDMLRMVCESLGAKVSTFSKVEDVDRAGRPDWILTDLNLPGLDASQPVLTYRNLGLQTPVILVSGRPQADLDELARATGAVAAVSKDLGISGMAEKLATILV